MAGSGIGSVSHLSYPSSAASGASDVTSREELAAFIALLGAEFRERGGGWENDTLDRYLGAMAAWIRSAPGWYANTGGEMPEGADWALLARALAAATVYE
ncbi:hypothetical protein ACFO4E_09545 [Nocardiopsis mangrovi]|uniref:DUF7660 domain-containing protein n=1 Tax=Nocardiopsis mangrovi TaxID=1179818 RepID=A0ABV9DUQ5_9ACTN